jgi:amidase
VEASELALASAAAQAAAIAEGQISSEELVRAYLDRISAYNPELNALVTVDAEAALAEARRRDQQLADGSPAGPLHGLPISVKDALAVAGMRSTGGIPRYAEHVPSRDAEAVARVRKTGGVILGKTNMPTANADFQSRNPVFGVTNNPWDRSRTPGGSCGGGGAAVAAGLSSLELGSEIGGSLRIPAHFCGLYAHKSSFRTCPMTGHIPPGPEIPGRDVVEFDLAVIGGIARSPADLELLLQSVAGPAGEEARAWTLAFPPLGRRSSRSSASRPGSTTPSLRSTARLVRSSTASSTAWRRKGPRSIGHQRCLPGSRSCTRSTKPCCSRPSAAIPTTRSSARKARRISSSMLPVIRAAR